MSTTLAATALLMRLWPALFARLRRAGNRWQGDAGTLLAGGLLVLVAAWALWIDVAHRVALWCGLA